MTDEQRDARLHKVETANTVLTIIPYTLFVVLIGAAVYASIYYNNKATAYASEAETLPKVVQDVSTVKTQVGTISEQLKSAPPANVAVAELSRRVDELSNRTTELKNRIDLVPRSALPADGAGNAQQLEQEFGALQKQQVGITASLDELRKMFEEFNRQYQANEARQNEIIQGLARRLNTPVSPDSPIRRVPNRGLGRPPG